MSADRRVMVTGAGGFIGGRVVEIMHLLDGWSPRAGLRVWSNGARVGRMPIELVQCDIMEPKQVQAAIEGVDAVVHCAVGPREVIVEGTRNLLEASRAKGLSRFVHLSTVDVYGETTGSVTEEHPLRVTSKEYGDSKIEAEELCREFRDLGLPVVVLRPTIVYGPFCGEWVVNYVDRLAAGRWPVPRDDAVGTCNLVYVDDLVAAILEALTRDRAVGEAFNVNGPQENLSWNDYFSALASSAGITRIDSPGFSRSRLEAALMSPIRKTARVTLDRFEEPILQIYKSSRTMRSAMKKLEAVVRRTPTPNEFTYYSREITYGCEKARRILGYRPEVPLEEGIALTGRWLAHHGYVPAGQ